MITKNFQKTRRRHRPEWTFEDSFDTSSEDSGYFAPGGGTGVNPDCGAGATSPPPALPPSKPRKRRAPKEEEPTQRGPTVEKERPKWKKFCGIQ